MRVSPIIATFVLASLTVAFSLAGCGPVPSTADAAPAAPVVNAAPAAGDELPLTPGATVQAMLELASAGEWGEYVDRFYGEQHKFRPGHDDRGTLVKRLAQRGDQLIPLLEQVTGMEPVLSEDGRLARYAFPNEQYFTLYRDDDGSWKFHL